MLAWKHFQWKSAFIVVDSVAQAKQASEVTETSPPANVTYADPAKVAGIVREEAQCWSQLLERLAK